MRVLECGATSVPPGDERTSTRSLMGRKTSTNMSTFGDLLMARAACVHSRLAAENHDRLEEQYAGWVPNVWTSFGSRCAIVIRWLNDGSKR